MKGRYPYFPMYAADFVNDPYVRSMSPAEVGAYALLLCHAWIEDGLPDDLRILASLTHTVLESNQPTFNTCSTNVQQTFNSIWETLQQHWKKGADGRLRNPRQEMERELLREKSQKRSVAGKASARVRCVQHTKGKNNKCSTNVQQVFNKRSTIQSQNISSVNTTKKKPDCVPAAKIVEIYNTATKNTSLRRCLHAKQNTARHRLLQARWAEHPDAAWWQDVFTQMAASPFLCGENDRRWVADFDWIVKPGNAEKVLEGKYLTLKPAPAGDQDRFSAAWSAHFGYPLSKTDGSHLFIQFAATCDEKLLEKAMQELGRNEKIVVTLPRLKEAYRIQVAKTQSGKREAPAALSEPAISEAERHRMMKDAGFPVNTSRKVADIKSAHK